MNPYDQSRRNGRVVPSVPVFRDVLVGPLAQESKTRIAFKCDPSLPLTHLRRGDQDAALREPFSDPPNDVPTVDDPVIYGGQLFLQHFGHALAESIHRVWPRILIPQMGKHRLAFHAPVRCCALAPPTWAVETFEMLGIDWSEMILIDRVMLFRELHIPVQARTMAGPTVIDGYPEIYPVRRDVVSGEDLPKRIYVTKSSHRYSGSYLGESLIERTLSQAGFSVIRPENESVTRMARMLTNADIAVFCEGSAIHTLEVIGRVKAPVFVIARRSGAMERFGPLLSAIASKWELHEELLGCAAISWVGEKGKPDQDRGCSFVDIRRLLAALSKFSGIDLPEPPEDDIWAAVKVDLVDYILDPKSTYRKTTDEQLGRLLRGVRQEFERVRRLAL
jgi:Glycosyltransferase 61